MNWAAFVATAFALGGAWAKPAYGLDNGCYPTSQQEKCAANQRRCYYAVSGACPAGTAPLYSCLPRPAGSTGYPSCATRAAAPGSGSEGAIYDTPQAAYGRASTSNGESQYTFSPVTPAEGGNASGGVSGCSRIGATQNCTRNGRTYRCTSFSSRGACEGASVVKNSDGSNVTPKQAQGLVSSSTSDFNSDPFAPAPVAPEPSLAQAPPAPSVPETPSQTPPAPTAAEPTTAPPAPTAQTPPPPVSNEDPMRILESQEGTFLAKNSTGSRSTGDGGAAISEAGECNNSERLDGASCGATKVIVEGSKITNQVTQMVGSVATQVMGQAAQQEAMAKGTQSDTLRAAGETQVTSGKIQISTGALNTLLGATQLVRMAQHSSSASKIHGGLQNGAKNLRPDLDTSKAMGKGATGEDSAHHGYIRGAETGVTQKAFEQFELGRRRSLYEVTVTQAQIDAAAKTPILQRQLIQQRKAQIEARERGAEERVRDVKREMGSIATRSRSEQNRASEQAMAGGMMSLITGAQQVTAGTFSVIAGNKLKDAAKQLQNAENTAMTGGALPGFDNLSGEESSAPRQATVITGSGEDPNASEASEDDVKDEPIGDLGRGFNPNGPPTPPGTGPVPGAFTKKNNEGTGGGGGGMGGGGGGSTSPANEGQGDPSAKYAELNKSQGTYDVGGAAFGGGGGGGGVGAGPDLSGLLAKFLPKEEEDAAKNGILDFGGREPASEQPESLLDRNANIFQRVHQTYQEKNQKGLVGVF